MGKKPIKPLKKKAAAPAAGEGVPPPATPSGRIPTVKGAPQKVQAQPVKTDKFGLMLVILVNLLLITSMIIWDKANERSDRTMFSRISIEEYDRQISPSPTLVAYRASGQLNKMRGEVDTVVLDKGFRDGVRMGDVFRPESPAPFEVKDKYFCEFCVFELADHYSLARIVMGTTWSERPTLRLLEASMTRMWPPNNTKVTRAWKDQEARIAIQQRFSKPQQ